MSALSDFHIVDLSTGIAGPLCTKLFADFGADVIKVEPPGRGDEARDLGPFPDSRETPESSGLFIYLNTNKRSITLDVKTDQGKHILSRLLATADVVVESFPPGTIEGLGLGLEALEQARPGIILTSITPFGQTGPWRDYQATDLVEYAASGLSYVNGLPGREPLKEPGYQSYYHAGLCGFLGTMTAILQREVTGVGDHVDVSILEAATSMFSPQILGALHSGRSPTRRAPGLPSGLLPCKDGYVFLNVRHEPTWQHMWLFFEEPEMADDPRFTTVTDRRRRSKELEQVLLPRLAQYTMEELLHGLSPLRIMVGMALDMPGLVNDPHLGEREFFVRSRHPVAGEVTHPGAPFRMSETPWELESLAPLLGQHNEEVYASLLGYSPQDVESWRAQGVI